MAGKNRALRTQLEKWLETQADWVKKKLKIVDSDILKQDYMLHIDKNRPPIFYPMLPKSAGDDENNTVPRVSVSPNLIGCIIGYARVDMDLLTSADRTKDQEEYKGGYIISEIDFQYAVAPSTDLVYDADKSDEIWLVNFCKEYSQYPSKEIGKLFVSFYTVTPSKKGPITHIEAYVQIDKEDGIMLTRQQFLCKGYHRITLQFIKPQILSSENDKIEHKRDVGNEKAYESIQVTQRDYEEAKQVHAAMLSFKEPKKDTPKYMHLW